MRRVVIFITPASVASDSINASILAALRVLLCSKFCATAVNAAWNSGVDVCFFHFIALELYSARQSPSIHRYVFLLSLSYLSSAGKFALGWLTLYSASGLVDGDASRLVGCPAFGVACGSRDSGMVTTCMS